MNCRFHHHHHHNHITLCFITLIFLFYQTCPIHSSIINSCIFRTDMFIMNVAQNLFNRFNIYCKYIYLTMNISTSNFEILIFNFLDISRMWYRQEVIHVIMLLRVIVVDLSTKTDCTRRQKTMNFYFECVLLKINSQNVLHFLRLFLNKIFDINIKS